MVLRYLHDKYILPRIPSSLSVILLINRYSIDLVDYKYGYILSSALPTISRVEYTATDRDSYSISVAASY